VTPLAARTRSLPSDAAPDLLAFAGEDGWVFERDGVGLAMRGVAARVAVRDVGACLASIAVDDEVGLPGTGAIAATALPFDPDAATVADAVIPAVVLGRTADETSWVTTIRAREVDLDAGEVLVDHRSAARAPDAFTLTPTVSHADWCEIIAKAVARIADGAFSKVVLAREVVVEASSDIVVSQVLARLQVLYPSCTVFSADGFVGASPELLVSRYGDTVTSHPLAGTIAHSGDADADRRASERLLASAKDREEHGLVVSFVADVLRPFCDSLDVPDAPSIVAMRNVAHLGTLVRGRLRDDPAPSALSLALALHPTPAVAGTPTHEAVAYLKSVEGFDRGRYAGAVGWVDGRGDGAFVVGIRCAEIAGRLARLFAGVGVVEGSDPDDELAETQLKLQALLAAVVRP
jgi:menaquinone-specific isochorismate synthase